MQIVNYKNQSTNFKAAFPVQHWFAESVNGSYALADMQTAKKLQGKIIRMLNRPSAENTAKQLVPREQNFITYMESCDSDYRKMCELERKIQQERKCKNFDSKKYKPITKVRSFYDRESSNVSSYSPLAYIISGKDIEPFEEGLAKNIGKEKKNAKELLSHPYSPQTLQAIDLYNTCGLNFVNNPDLRIKDKKTGMTYVLHTKFEIIRNKLGKIKDYRFVDARFLPEYGPESPFTKLGYTK